ncbi:MAG: TRAP transporter large permease subunit [Halomonas sp.]
MSEPGSRNDYDIAITLGDPAGIGPEIICRALAAMTPVERRRSLVVGDIAILRRAAALIGADLTFVPEERAMPDAAGVAVSAVDAGEAIPDGVQSAAAGDLAYRCVKRAVERVQAGRARVIVTDVAVVHRMINGVDSYPLLAIPFVILAGNLMNNGGITTRIFDFAKALMGWMRGGLGHVNVGASIVFSGMPGAAVADAGGLGTIEIKAMRDAGYDQQFAVGITAASSTIGPIIPPSLPMVIYGVMASVSVGQLFVAGLIPGLLMGAVLMVMITWLARRRGYPRDATFVLSVLGHTSRRAFLSLLTPVIIVGGIMSGAFTPTEAAIAAVVYALFLGSVVYRTLTWRRLLKVSMETIETTAVILLIVADAFAPGEPFATCMRAYLDDLRDQPGRDGARVMAPGDREWACRAHRDAEGISLDNANQAAYTELAERLDVRALQPLD